VFKGAVAKNIVAVAVGLIAAGLLVELTVRIWDPHGRSSDGGYR